MYLCYLDAIWNALKESFLVEVIHLISSTNITRNVRQLLSPLYTYLSNFVYSHDTDICGLLPMIESQLWHLARTVFHDQVVDTLCFEETVKQYNVKFVKSIMEQLEPLLGRLGYLLRGYEYRNQIIEFMSSYHAPSHCVQALMRMTFCSICTRGTTPFPCHNLCLNTIQGCLVDFADLHQSAKDMINKLNRTQSQLHLNINIKHVGIKLQRYILGLKDDSGLIKQKVSRLFVCNVHEC